MLTLSQKSIASLSLASHPFYLAIAYEGNEVFIYRYANISFSPFQTLHFHSSTRKKVQLSHDHQHLLVAHQDGLVEVYRFGSDSFELALSSGDSFGWETV